MSRCSNGFSGKGRIVLLVFFISFIFCRNFIFAEIKTEQKVEDFKTFYVQLSINPAVNVYLENKNISNAEKKSLVLKQVQKIDEQQKNVTEKIKKLGFRKIYNLNKLANVLLIQAPPSKIQQLRVLKDVINIEPVPIYTLDTEISVPFIGAPSAWDPSIYKATGEGIKIGIIDTGIDYTHANFGGSGDPADYTNNDRTGIEPGSFPTAKVVGGWDFVGDEYDASKDTSNIPKPDPDPLDCNGHGSHVAGIAAGFGVLLDGKTYTGEYSSSMDMTQFHIGPGVAPKASLYALKIFGCSGSTDIIAPALEWAADPNNDGDFSDRLDVVNLSLGSNFGNAYYFVEEGIVNKLTDLGTAVVGSSGNAGNTCYITGSVGSLAQGICVANSYDNYGDSYSAIKILSPASIAGDYKAVEGAITYPMRELKQTSGTLVYVEPALACTDLTNPEKIAGNIALIDRGTCNFSDKILKAQAAGAIGVVVVNNSSAAPIAMGGSSEGINIPGYMIYQADGNILKNHLSEGIVVKFDYSINIPNPTQTDTLATSSSRGPNYLQFLKPDISAPGSHIFSTYVGKGYWGTIKSGTSMAAPHIAGVVALIKQTHPYLNVEGIKAVMMNTAVPIKNTLGDKDIESRAGAGRVSVPDILKANVTVAAVDTSKTVSLNFGYFNISEATNVTKEVRITNHGDTAISFDIAIETRVQRGGVSIIPQLAKVEVPAKSSINVPFMLTLDPVNFDRVADIFSGNQNSRARSLIWEYSGEILFLNSELNLHLPFYTIVQQTNDRYTPSSVVEFDAGDPFTTGTVEVNIPQAGAAVNNKAIASLFQLDYISPDKNYNEFYMRQADIQYIGTATNIRSAYNFNAIYLYWGISTFIDRTNPGTSFGEFDIIIDNNNDYVADCAIYNSDMGTYLNTTPSDRYVPVRYNFSTQERLWIEGFYTNIFEPETGDDTGIFNSNLIVIPTQAASIGLTESSTEFNYQIRSYLYGIPVDETPVLKFKFRKPIIHTATLKSYQFEAAMLDNKSSFPIIVDKEQYWLNPANAKLLIFHHLNKPGKRTEIITLKSPLYLGSADFWMLH